MQQRRPPPLGSVNLVHGVSNPATDTGQAGASTPTRQRIDGFGLAALAASGTLLAHQLGYLTDAEARNAHTYFAVVGPIVLVAAFVAMWSAAIRTVRRDAGRLPSVGALTAYQVGLYTVIEVGERIIGGEALGSLTSTPAILGLAAQPVVAWAALRFLRVGTRFLLALVKPSVRPERANPAPWTVAPCVVVSSFPRASIRLRGPPVG